MAKLSAEQIERIQDEARARWNRYVERKSRTYRPFTDESEDASGDNITYADESEYIGDEED